MTDNHEPTTIEEAWQLYLARLPAEMIAVPSRTEAVRRVFFIGAMAHHHLMAVASALSTEEEFHQRIEAIGNEIDAVVMRGFGPMQ